MLCILFFCVLCEKKNIFETRWGVLSLTELTDLTEHFSVLFNSWGLFSLTEHTEFTEHFCAQFRAHRRPSAYRVHRALLLKVAVTFCEIGWLNVSVGLCVFCSSVFFCEKKNAPSIWDKTHENRWGVLSLTERTEFTEHFCAQFRAHRTPPAYRVHRALLLKVAVRFCEIGWLNVSVECYVFCSSVYSVRNRTHPLVWDNTQTTLWGGFFLTELTDVTEHFNQRFELTERLRHTEFTEAFQLRLAVTLCEIGWLNVSVCLCVFCSSVFSVRNRTHPLWRKVMWCYPYWPSEKWRKNAKRMEDI